MAFATQGTKLNISISSSLTPVANATRLKPNESTRAKIETTDLTSTCESSIPGIARYGEFEFDINYNPANATHAYLYASYQNSLGSFGAGVIEAWTQVLANGSVSADSGWISSWARGEATTDGLQKVTVKVQVTGSEVFTP